MWCPNPVQFSQLRQASPSAISRGQTDPAQRQNSDDHQYYGLAV